MALLGVILSVVCQPGECGRVSLTGYTRGNSEFNIQVREQSSAPFMGTFGLRVTCRVCASAISGCDNIPGAVVESVVGGEGARVYADGSWTTVSWDVGWEAPPARPLKVLNATVRCSTSRDAPNSRYVGVGVAPLRNSTPSGDPSVIVTNAKGYRSTIDRWRGVSMAGWYPNLDTRVDDVSGGAVSASLSYPETIVLNGRGATTPIVYDVKGDGGIVVVIDKPSHLACARHGDRLVVGDGMAVAVGPGDTITCTNELVEPGKTSGKITVTAMIK